MHQPECLPEQLPGDVVFIPDKRVKQVKIATQKRHQFKLKGIPVRVRVQFLDDDEPRAEETYTMTYQGGLRRGTTDEKGWLMCHVPPEVKTITVMLGDDEETYRIALGPARFT